MRTTTMMAKVSMILAAAIAGPAIVSGQPARLAQESQTQWAKFRGPDNGAVADDPRLPDTWSETTNVVWKADVPGLGWSSPVSGTTMSF